MKTEEKIVTYLLAHKMPTTIRHLAAQVGSDYKIVHTAVMRLITSHVLRAEQVGQAKQLTLSSKLSATVLAAEVRRQEKILQNKNFVILRDAILAAAGPLCIIILFGSYAKGTQTKHSDIDVMIILPDEKNEKAIERDIALLPLAIHHNIINTQQFLQMHQTTKPNVVHEVAQNNIILHGIESYYQLIL